MKIIWFTGRLMSDMCSTTQISLANGLIENGHSLIFVNPDEQGSHNHCEWEHFGLPIKALPGLKSIILSQKMSRWIKQYEDLEESVAILDWRVASKLIPILEMKRVPWILMDRSPPADGNFLSKLQWFFWKRSWKLLKSRPDRLGCVVSDEHRTYVVKHTGLNPNSTIIITAGVDTELFIHSEKLETLQLSYHGRIDKNRGIMSLIDIFLILKKDGIKAELNLHGKGNIFDKIKKMNIKGLNLYEQSDAEDIAKHLSKYDIGFLPMPDSEIWRLASPLKRSEYLASGMVVCGINHAGHRIKNSGDWIQLFDENHFIPSTVDWIKNIKHHELRKLQKEARDFAEKNYKWEKIVDELSQILSKQS